MSKFPFVQGLSQMLVNRLITKDKLRKRENKSEGGKSDDRQNQQIRYFISFITRDLTIKIFISKVQTETLNHLNYYNEGKIFKKTTTNKLSQGGLKKGKTKPSSF